MYHKAIQYISSIGIYCSSLLLINKSNHFYLPLNTIGYNFNNQRINIKQAPQPRPAKLDYYLGAGASSFLSGVSVFWAEGFSFFAVGLRSAPRFT